MDSKSEAELKGLEFESVTVTEAEPMPADIYDMLNRRAHCEWCGKDWIKRGWDRPKNCPGCNRINWDQPKPTILAKYPKLGRFKKRYKPGSKRIKQAKTA